MGNKEEAVTTLESAKTALPPNETVLECYIDALT